MAYLWFFISRILRYSRLCIFFKISHSKIKLKFFPTSLSMSLWLNPRFSELDSFNIEANLNVNDTFVDIGANIGFLSLVAWSKIGNNGNIIAVEGNKRIASFLKKNVELNKANIKVLNVIVGEKNSYAGIQNRKADDMNQVVKVGKIKMKRLDDICRDLKTINLLKIDVEGYELPVLKGGVKTLKKTKLILLEILDSLSKKYSYSSNDLKDFLEKNNFILLKNLENGNFLYKNKGTSFK